MPDEENDIAPRASYKDILYKVGKTGVGVVGAGLSVSTGIPLVLATDLYSAIIRPPVEKRWNKWVETLADQVRDLKFTVSYLSNNPLFVTGFMHASQIVLRTHQGAKLDALRNAVSNLARPLFADENLLLMFMSWIDILTPWHMRVLELIRSQNDTVMIDDLNQEWLGEPIAWRVKSAFPAGEVDMDLIKQIFNDLSSRGTIKIDLLSSTVDGEIPFKVSITKIGTKFLDFINK
jgi:hypothetical protein